MGRTRVETPRADHSSRARSTPARSRASNWASKGRHGDLRRNPATDLGAEPRPAGEPRRPRSPGDERGRAPGRDRDLVALLDDPDADDRLAAGEVEAMAPEQLQGIAGCGDGARRGRVGQHRGWQGLREIPRRPTGQPGGGGEGGEEPGDHAKRPSRWLFREASTSRRVAISAPTGERSGPAQPVGGVGQQGALLGLLLAEPLDHERHLVGEVDEQVAAAERTGKGEVARAHAAAGVGERHGGTGDAMGEDDGEHEEPGNRPGQGGAHDEPRSGVLAGGPDHDREAAADGGGHDQHVADEPELDPRVHEEVAEPPLAHARFAAVADHLDLRRRIYPGPGTFPGL